MPADPDAVSDNVRGLPLLRFWRGIRRLSQLELGERVGVSQRHISFIESGRAQPSRWVLELLADGLAIPPHERSALFEQAGFAVSLARAPVPGEALEHALAHIDAVLMRVEPYPCLVLDRRLRIARANPIARRLFAAVVPARDLDGMSVGEVLLAAPVRCLIANLDRLALALLGRMQQLVALDPTMAGELRALLADPSLPEACKHAARGEPASRVIELRADARPLSFIAATTTLGTSADATFGELWLEVYLPCDAHSERALRTFASSQR